jgi:hypothetical protein
MVSRDHTALVLMTLHTQAAGRGRRKTQETVTPVPLYPFFDDVTVVIARDILLHLCHKGDPGIDLIVRFCFVLHSIRALVWYPRVRIVTTTACDTTVCLRVTALLVIEWQEKLQSPGACLRAACVHGPNRDTFHRQFKIHVYGVAFFSINLLLGRSI